jgi:hypothetical protein
LSIKIVKGYSLYGRLRARVRTPAVVMVSCGCSSRVSCASGVPARDQISGAKSKTSQLKNTKIPKI